MAYSSASGSCQVPIEAEGRKFFDMLDTVATLQLGMAPAELSAIFVLMDSQTASPLVLARRIIAMTLHVKHKHIRLRHLVKGHPFYLLFKFCTSFLISAIYVHTLMCTYMYLYTHM